MPASITGKPEKRSAHQLLTVSCCVSEGYITVSFVGLFDRRQRMNSTLYVEWCSLAAAWIKPNRIELPVEATMRLLNSIRHELSNVDLTCAHPAKMFLSQSSTTSTSESYQIMYYTLHSNWDYFYQLTVEKNEMKERLNWGPFAHIPCPMKQFGGVTGRLFSLTMYRTCTTHPTGAPHVLFMGEVYMCWYLSDDNRRSVLNCFTFHLQLLFMQWVQTSR